MKKVKMMNHKPIVWTGTINISTSSHCPTSEKESSSGIMTYRVRYRQQSSLCTIQCSTNGQDGETLKGTKQDKNPVLIWTWSATTVRCGDTWSITRSWSQSGSPRSMAITPCPLELTTSLVERSSQTTILTTLEIPQLRE